MIELIEKLLVQEGGFADPFPGMMTGKEVGRLTDSELTRAIRLDIAAEEEAIHLYQAHADATGNEKAKKVLLSIADEERVHVGELQKLLKDLVGDEEELLDKGAKEVEEV